jgi:hypothetical protein
MAGQHKNPSIAALRKLEASLDAHLRDQHAWSVDERSQRYTFQLTAAQQAAAQRQAQAAQPQAAAQVEHAAADDHHDHNVPEYAHGYHEEQVYIPPVRLRDRRFNLLPRSPRLRKLTIAGGAVFGVVMLAMAALWWRLASGPIELDVATPWLSAAIRDNFGPGHEVEIGGTQLERDAHGRTALRIRDIVVRDADGTIVASAPKAEVGISGAGLLTGRIRAHRLSLVGAEMAVRIESDSKVTVFAGSNKQPFVTASAAAIPVTTSSLSNKTERPAADAVAPAPVPPTASRGGIPDFAALLAWIESLDASGLDGRDLAEIGLKGGNLTVDDDRNGKQWTFSNIDLSVTRPKGGGIAVSIGSEAAEQPWLMRAAMTPGERGHRVLQIETQKVSAKDLMLALRLGELPYEPELSVSARVRADIGTDGLPKMVEGRIQIDKGFIIDLDDPQERIPIDRAEVNLEWDAARNAMVMPFQIVSGGNRITLMAQADAPRQTGEPWGLKITGGTIVLASAAQPDANPLILNRVNVKLRIDPARQRVDVEQGELGNMELGVALSGGLDYSAGEPRVAVGVAGTRMPVAAMKQIWPAFVAPKVRNWVEHHVAGGSVERLMIATNAPLNTLRESGPPIPDEGLAVDIVGQGVEVRPVHGLPGIRDADFNVKVTGRTATINIGRGNVEVSPGRKLSVTNGVFEVADTFPKAPPAKVRFRLDGSVPAALELLSMERLRDYSSTPIDPATSRGTLTAQVTLGMPLKADLAPGSSSYTIAMDVVNFGAEKMVMGHKVEAAALKVNANNHGYWIRGDVKINGVAANLDYRKPRDTNDAEVRLNTTLDENARTKLGLDLAGYLSGPVSLKLNGRMQTQEAGDSKFHIEADLTQSKIDNLLPGWSKPPGKWGRATFTLLNRPSNTRFDDLVVEGPGLSVKGAVEVDGAGDVISANFPVFTLSDGDKATLRAERGPDGTLRVTMRGDVYDGRGFVKSSMAGQSSAKSKHDTRDVDLDVKIGTVAGFHGETLRGLDLRLSRRNGTVTNLSLNAKLGRNTPLTGDLRSRQGSTRQVVFLETSDAGAFFRFSDIYPKIVGGEMWVAMDPQNADQAPQDGILNIRDFTVRGEASLDRVAGAQASGVEFSRLRVEFTRSLGRFAIREGLVRGPVIGATVDGYIDYMKDDLRMRGTFVPLYGLNNMFGQIPIVGLFLGGSNEGLMGVTYEVVGSPSAPVLRVNPISALAPGLLRKFFEFPTTNAPTGTQQSYADPYSGR